MTQQKPIAWCMERHRESVETGSLVLGDWEVLRQIGEGAYGRVFEIGKTVYGIEKRSALKVLSIPKNEQERQQLAMEMDEESVTQYLTSVVDTAVAELNVMIKLSEHPGIMRCEDFSVVQYEEDDSWDIFMRLELLESLPSYLKRNGTLTPNEIVRLGEEICGALAFCEDRHVMHRDVKPENIFINKTGNFKLGDFGMARIISESTMASSKKGTELYMAPEIIRGEKYGRTVDTYALGLVLYRLLNDNLLPFYPKGKMTIVTREQAFISRMKGEKMPLPAHADTDLSSIVLKACAFKPEDRYQSAEEMRAAIAGYRSGTNKEELYWNLSHRSMIAETPEELTALADEWKALCYRDSAEMAKACQVRAERLIATRRALEEAKRRKREGENAEQKTCVQQDYFDLAVRYENGIGVEKNIQKAIELYRKAAENGNVLAQNELGNRYQYGSGVSQDHAQAFYWYQKAAKQGNSEAQNHLGICYENGFGTEKNLTRAVIWYTKSAKNGNALAQNELGYRYQYGSGVSRDHAQAFYWYQKAAEQGNSAAQNHLGICYENGFGTEKNPTQAVFWYTKSAKQGNTYGQYDLAVCYENGIGLEKNIQKAIELYRIAAEHGNALAQNALGYRYQYGNGVSQDHAQAFYWYQKSAEQGNSAAQNNLGICYENGYGTEKNPSQAVFWYTKSAEQGNTYGQYDLAVCYENGIGVEKNIQKAIELYRIAAENGNALAQNELGYRYHHGNGVSQDYELALYWYQKSAEQGNSAAQNSLGICYKNGYGTEKNPSQAVFWYTKSAEQGNMYGQYDLAICYENGIGVEKNIQKAIELYRKASEQGLSSAKAALKRI